MQADDGREVSLSDYRGKKHKEEWKLLGRRKFLGYTVTTAVRLPRNTKGLGPPEECRRNYLKTVGTLVAGLAVGGVVGWLSKPAERITETVPDPTSTVTETVTKTVTAITPIPTPTPKPGPKPYEGIKLVYGGHKDLYSYLTGPIRKHKEEWSLLTGGEVEVIEIPFGELYTKILESLTGAGTYDFIMVNGSWTGDYLPYILPLDKYVSAMPEWDWNDVLPIVQKKDMYGGKIMNITLDNDGHLLMYRKDVLANPDYQEKFRDKYGYDLPVPPETIEQYIDVGEYFNGWDWDGDGEIEHGIIIGLSDMPNWYALDYVAPYVVLPSPPAPATGILYFNPETMEPLVNTPGWIKGIEKFVEAVKRAHPPGLAWNRTDAIQEYILGRICMEIDWMDSGPASLSPESKTKGKIGFSLSPGSHETWDWMEEKWVRWDEVHRAPMHNFNGWALMISKTCKHPDVAWSFISYHTSKVVSDSDMASPCNGYQPWRISHGEDIDLWVRNGWIEEDAKQYIRAVRDFSKHPNATLDLRIPGANRYHGFGAPFQTWMLKLLAGETTVKTALDNIAKEWNAITDEIGREKQIKAYRESLGLPV